MVAAARAAAHVPAHVPPGSLWESSRAILTRRDSARNARLGAVVDLLFDHSNKSPKLHPNPRLPHLASLDRDRAEG